MLFWVPAVAVYVFAPLGVLGYTLGVIVFIRIERAIWSRFQPPGSTPSVLMFF